MDIIILYCCCVIKIHEHAPYFVDALWDYTAVLKVPVGSYNTTE